MTEGFKKLVYGVVVPRGVLVLSLDFVQFTFTVSKNNNRLWLKMFLFCTENIMLPKANISADPPTFAKLAWKRKKVF